MSCSGQEVTSDMVDLLPLSMYNTVRNIRLLKYQHAIIFEPTQSRFRKVRLHLPFLVRFSSSDVCERVDELQDTRYKIHLFAIKLHIHIFIYTIRGKETS